MTKEQKERLLGVNRNWAQLLTEDEYQDSFDWAFEQGWQDAGDMETAYRAGYDDPSEWEDQKFDAAAERFEAQVEYYHMVMSLPYQG